MITKVKTLRQSSEFASNFEYDPESSNGLDFHHFGGSVVDQDRQLVEISAAGVSIPANGTYNVYVDMAEVTPQIKRETTITSGNYVLLYTVQTGPTDISSITDRRSWTAAAIGEDLTPGGGGGATITPFDTSIAALSPVIDYRFDHSERTGDLVNYGSAGTDWNMPLVNSVVESRIPQWVNINGGDVNKTGNALALNCYTDNQAADQGFELNPVPADRSSFTSLTEGTIVICVAYQHLLSSLGAVFDFRGSSASDDRLSLESFNQKARFNYWGDSGANFWDVRTTADIGDTNLNPQPEWYMFTIVQPADGGGALFYVNGVDDSDQNIGGGEEDLWIADIAAGWEYWAIGGLYGTPGTNLTTEFIGFIDRLVITGTALTPAEVSDLYDDYTTVV